MCCALAIAASSSSTAKGDPSLAPGFADDAFEWAPSTAATDASALGARLDRVTLDWAPGETTIGVEQAAMLARTLAVLHGTRLVVAVYGAATASPTTDNARTDYCSYVASFMRRFPAINDVVIWNEPNKSQFWRPQFNSD